MGVSPRSGGPWWMRGWGGWSAPNVRQRASPSGGPPGLVFSLPRPGAPVPDRHGRGFSSDRDSWSPAGLAGRGNRVVVVHSGPEGSLSGVPCSSASVLLRGDSRRVREVLRGSSAAGAGWPLPDRQRPSAELLRFAGRRMRSSRACSFPQLDREGSSALLPPPQFPFPGAEVFRWFVTSPMRLVSDGPLQVDGFVDRGSRSAVSPLRPRSAQRRGLVLPALPSLLSDLVGAAWCAGVAVARRGACRPLGQFFGQGCCPGAAASSAPIRATRRDMRPFLGLQLVDTLRQGPATGGPLLVFVFGCSPRDRAVRVAVHLAARGSS